MQPTPPIFAALVLATTSLGCALPIEESDADEHTAQVEQPLAVLGTASWGSGNGPDPLYLGPSSNRTCFLTGIRGQLFAHDSAPPAKVGVYMQGGDWWLEAEAGNGGGVIGDAVCIANVADREVFGYTPNSSTSANWVSHWRGRQCFLSHFSVSSGFAWQGSNTFMPGASVEKKTIWPNGDPELSWVLSAKFVPEQGGGAGGSVSAVCVRMKKHAEVPFSWDSPTPVNVMNANGVACGFKSIVGNFFDGGPTSANGAVLYQDAGWWKVRAGYTKGVTGSCIY